MNIGSIILEREMFEQVMDKKISKIDHAITLSSDFSNQRALKSVVFAIRDRKLSKNNLLSQNRSVVTGKVLISAEMSAISSNRVTLSKYERDFLGQPIAHVNFQFLPQEIHAAAEHLNAELVRSGIGRMSILPKKFGLVEGDT